MQHPQSIKALKAMTIRKPTFSETSIRLVSSFLSPPTRTELASIHFSRGNSPHLLAHSASRVPIPVAAFNQQPLHQRSSQQQLKTFSSKAALSSTPLSSRSHSTPASPSSSPRQSSFSSSASPSSPPSVLPRSTIKRRKEHSLDRVVDRNKKFVTVQRMIELLNQTEDGSMSLRELGRFRGRLGISSGRRLVALVRRFPRVFSIEDQQGGHVWFRLSPRAAALRKRELQLRAEREPRMVDKVCKFLMMSVTQSLSLESIGHIRRELGLPEDFKASFILAHPAHFTVQQAVAGPVVVLTQWREELAVTDMEAREREEREREEEEEGEREVGRQKFRNLSQALDGGETSRALDDARVGGINERRESGDTATQEGNTEYAHGITARQQDAAASDSESDADDDDVFFDAVPSHSVIDGDRGLSKHSSIHSPNGLSGDAAAAAAIAAGRELVGAGLFTVGGRSGDGNNSTGSSRQMRKRVELNLPPGMKLKRADLERLRVFHSQPLPSPYEEEAREAPPDSQDAERRAVAVIAEMLALTVEGRCLVDHLTHFRKDFRLPARIRSLLVRHPEFFYVSEKGVRDSVFLRSAYDGDRLRRVDELTQVLEEMRLLVQLGKKGTKRESGQTKRMGDDSEGEEDEEEEWDSEDEWEESDAEMQEKEVGDEREHEIDGNGVSSRRVRSRQEIEGQTPPEKW